MSREERFTKLLDGAPKVQCPTCSVEMVLRTLSPHPTPKTELYAATYRCPVCAFEDEREFLTDL